MALVITSFETQSKAIKALQEVGVLPDDKGKGFQRISITMDVNKLMEVEIAYKVFDEAKEDDTNE